MANLWFATYDPDLLIEDLEKALRACQEEEERFRPEQERRARMDREGKRAPYYVASIVVSAVLGLWFLLSGHDIAGLVVGIAGLLLMLYGIAMIFAPLFTRKSEREIDAELVDRLNRRKELAFLPPEYRKSSIIAFLISQEKEHRFVTMETLFNSWEQAQRFARNIDAAVREGREQAQRDNDLRAIRSAAEWSATMSTLNYLDGKK